MSAELGDGVLESVLGIAPPWRGARRALDSNAAASLPARARRRRWVKLLTIVDALVISSVMLFAWNTVVGVERGGLFPYLPIMAFSWFVILGVGGARRAEVLGRGVDEYRRVIGASLLAVGLMAFTGMELRLEGTRQVAFSALLAGPPALLLARWLLRRLLRHRAKSGATLSKVVVIGCASDIEYVVSRVSKASSAGYQIVALIEDTGTSMELEPLVPVTHNPEDLEHMISTHGADAVIVAGQLNAGKDAVRNLGWELERLGAEMILASNLTNVASSRIHIREVDGLPLMHVERPALSGMKMRIKRAVDICLTTIALTILLPVFLMIAIAIRMDSKGPVIFAQRRIGKRGQEFTMLKFRTMCVDAESRLDGLKDQNEGAGPLFKMKGDPRVTKIGKLLRKTSLDELPQLINVIKGDMSLVGPRPPLPCEVETYERHTFRRLLIRPGLTGLWQISGRSNLSWEDSVRLDLYYVENWSLVDDLVIMCHTAKAMIRPSGAY
ncbi:polyprenyl glycosylphosphotransferase [Arthrobacter sp. 7749]|nr:polyprenyl glycosylphosphotransferase [Arthrobacter sp. 7749]